jgi:fatty acid synthase subunit alpha
VEITEIDDLASDNISRGRLSSTIFGPQRFVIFESFTENTKKAIHWLFFCGLRAQETFHALSLEPGIVDDAVEGGEGVPSPMLAVTGLALNDLEPHIKKTNDHLPANSQLHVSLHNGPRAFVLTGPARALYGLVTTLRKVRAPSELDQSKTLFSQKKLVFSVRVLTVNAPFHSEYLASATDKFCTEDLGGEELWTTMELGIPIYNGMKTFSSILATSLTHVL